MNPTTLEAVKLLLELQNQSLVTKEQKELALKMIDKLLFIMSKDVDQGYEKYAQVKLV